MALVTCPECRKEISTKAEACPSCGYPLRGTVLIEQTSKRWKKVQVVGLAIVVLGLVLIGVAISLQSSEAAILTAAITATGIGVYSIGSVLAWWYHG